VQIFFHFCAGIGYNVRRYVALAQSRGGAQCPAPIEVRSGCFCTRGAMKDYDVICIFSRWQKP